MKKQIICLTLFIFPVALTACNSGGTYDTNYLLRLIRNTEKEPSELPQKSSASSVEEAEINFNEYIVNNLQKNNYLTIRDEIIFSCLNFISKTNSDSDINGLYRLNSGDTFKSLYEEKKIVMQTKISNFYYKWSQEDKLWEINSSAIIISIQFRDDYLYDSINKYNKGSLISYDFFLQSTYLKYIATEEQGKYKFIREISFRKNSENIYGIVEAQINGTTPPIKSITQLPLDSKIVNNYFVKKK